MPDAGKIERVLGLTNASQGSSLSLAERIERGLPVESLTRISQLVAPGDPGFAIRIVPAHPQERRRREHKRLTPEESERVWRVARAWVAARDVYQSAALARAFLRRPHPMLERHAPLKVVLGNTHQLNVVEALLGRAKYGMAA